MKAYRSILNQLQTKVRMSLHKLERRKERKRRKKRSAVTIRDRIHTKFSVVYLKMPTKNTGMISRTFRFDNADRIPVTEESFALVPTELAEPDVLPRCSEMPLELK